jgi:hypothetical protein
MSNSEIRKERLQLEICSHHHLFIIIPLSVFYQYFKHSAATTTEPQCDQVCILFYSLTITVMRRVMMGMYSEKFVVRRFCHCANILQCTYTNLDSTAYYTSRLYGIYRLLLLGYKPVQHVTVLNTVDNCNTLVCIIIL